MSEAYDAIIVGAGPAGLTAGLYCGQAGLKVLVLGAFSGTLLTRLTCLQGQSLTTAVLRLFPKPSPDDRVGAIRSLAGGLAQREIAGKLWIGQKGRIREYRPRKKTDGRANPKSVRIQLRPLDAL